MYIRKTKAKGKNGKVYVNYLLVESRQTPKGPRQFTICSLGNLKPGPIEYWIAIAKKVQRALSDQKDLIDGIEPPDPLVQDIVAKVHAREEKQRSAQEKQEAKSADTNIIAVEVDKVVVEKPRELGPVHVGSAIYDQLGIETTLKAHGFSQNACDLTRIQVLNRLIYPASEHAMPDWFHRTALQDLMESNMEGLSDDALYLNLDRILPLHESLETALIQRENDLFDLEDTLFFYDLTSTYFEGQMEANPMAQRGYSRDKRSDCKQVVMGFAVNNQGFLRAHEVFDGNRTDSTTVGEMLDSLGRRVELKPGATVIVDRGMSFDKNLDEITSRGLYYIVACRQTERKQWLDELENAEGWEEVFREPSPTNPSQRKSEVLIKRLPKSGETLIACISEGRRQKDRAIREKKEGKFLQDLEKLHKRVEKYALLRSKLPPTKESTRKKTDQQDRNIWESIGRLKERHPRVSRYYKVVYDAENVSLTSAVEPEKLAVAQRLDGSYLLKTNRKDLDGEKIWRTYMLLTRAESAFRDMKSPLVLRPIFHQKAERTRAHILLCVLAYHLLVAIEHQLRKCGDHRSWETIRELLRTHQAMTVVLPTTSGEEFRIRRGTVPEPPVAEVYKKLSVPREAFTPVKHFEISRSPK